MAPAVGGVLGLPSVGGDPGALKDAAAECRGIAGTFARMAGQLRTVGMSDGWSGTAAAAFGGRMLGEADVVELGDAAWHSAARALDELADDLRELRGSVERWEDEARDLDSVREGHERAAAEESVTADAARARSLTAGSRASIAELSASPSAASHRDEQAREWRAAADATLREAVHRRAAGERARELEEIREAAHRRVARYRKIADGAAARLRVVASAAPHVNVAYGTPEPAITTTAVPTALPPLPTRVATGPAGKPWLDGQAYADQLRPSSTDSLKAANWWVGVLGGVGLSSAEGFIKHLRTYPPQVQQVFLLALTRELTTRTPGDVMAVRSTIFITGVRSAPLISATRMARLLVWSERMPAIGTALTIGGASFDDWRDTRNSNLSTTERLGRAAGKGGYIGGASIVVGALGAGAGSLVFPGPGTVAGAAMGSLMGSASAAAVTPLVDVAGKSGELAAKGLRDAADEIGEAFSAPFAKAPHG